MDNLIKALLSGILFGLWPMLMNRSGLNGYLASGVFALGGLILVAPFAISYGAVIGRVSWLMAILAAACSASGLLIFNDLLAKITPQAVGRLFVIMLIAQILVPAVYHLSKNGLTMDKLFGFLAAVIAAYLLMR